MDNYPVDINEAHTSKLPELEQTYPIYANDISDTYYSFEQFDKGQYFHEEVGKLDSGLYYGWSYGYDAPYSDDTLYEFLDGRWNTVILADSVEDILEEWNIDKDDISYPEFVIHKDEVPLYAITIDFFDEDKKED